LQALHGNLSNKQKTTSFKTFFIVTFLCKQIKQPKKLLMILYKINLNSLMGDIDYLNDFLRLPKASGAVFKP
jgi:hypothetical protein